MALSDIHLQQLVLAAREASKNAYAPYSGFVVGAAVLAGENHIFSGCNIENASYGLAICAERSAIFGAISKGLQNIRAVAIYTPTEEPSLPCGACLQVIQEFAADADIICACNTSEVTRLKLNDLLPHPFKIEGIVQDREDGEFAAAKAQKPIMC